MRENAPDTTTPSPEPYYTVAEIAAQYKTGREQVHRWIRSGDLEAERIGKLVRVPQAALDAFRRRHAVPARKRRA